MDFDVDDLDRAKWTFTIGSHARDFLDQFDGSVIALSEDGVAAIEARVGNFGDEELRTVGIRSGVRVSHTSGTIEGNRGRSLVLEFVAGIARTVAFGVSPLNHEFWNHAMKDSAIIKRNAVLFDLTDGAGPIFAAVCEADEVGDSNWRDLRKQDAMQIACCGVDDRGWLGGRRCSGLVGGFGRY